MMTVAAIAAEYNPFHNGHAYQIAQTRAAGATHIVAVMSGNFTQRGTPAFAEKRARSRSALSGGADLIVELPLALRHGDGAALCAWCGQHCRRDGMC